MSPLFHEVLGPLEHSVLDHAGPAGQHVAVGLLRTLSPSDCHPAGPVGPYVAGGPGGPDGTLKVLEPLEHSVLDHADPAGQHAVLQEVLEPLEHSVVDHAHPAGQHAVVQEVLEPLEHSVLNAALVCYDCLCLMALFRAVMSLARYWADEFAWTGSDEGYCCLIAWEEWYLPWLHPPCVVDRLCGYLTEIKVPGFVLMLNRDRNNSARWCACMHKTSLGVFSVGRISLMLIGCSACVDGSVDCSDWPRSDCAVDFSPGGVWIGYIMPGLWDVSLIDATPVTGSLVSSALFDCLDLYCTAGFSSLYWTFCDTDCVLLAGFQLFLRRVLDDGNERCGGGGR